MLALHFSTCPEVIKRQYVASVERSWYQEMGQAPMLSQTTCVAKDKMQQQLVRHSILIVFT